MFGERGQAVVEFGLLSTAFFFMTIVTLDVGRAFFDNNGLATATRYAARWASVVGGTCTASSLSTSDWCQQSGNPASFWSQNGNKPLQGLNIACPTHYDGSQNIYYNPAQYLSVPLSGGQATVVGQVAQKLDTNSGSISLPLTRTLPGISLNQLKVCVQVLQSVTGHAPTGGDLVGVYIYYPFDSGINPVSWLHLGSTPFYLQSSSAFILQ